MSINKIFLIDSFYADIDKPNEVKRTLIVVVILNESYEKVYF